MTDPVPERDAARDNERESAHVQLVSGREPLDVGLADGRQSQRASEIARGTARLLASLGFASVPEITLPNHRRADLMALGARGEVWIVEIKSSLVDFQVDRKWPEYADYCDRFFFAVAADFPTEVLPETTGLILADRFGAEVVVGAPEQKLSAARRKLVHLTIARTAAARLHRLADPEAILDPLNTR